MSEGSRTISYEDRGRLYDIRKMRFVSDIDTIAEQMYKGNITLGWWEEDMRTRLRMYMVGSASIGKGGRDNMTSSDWGKVGAELKKQYRWLHGFAKDIFAKKDTISLNAIKARAHLYADAGAKVATRMQAGYFEGVLPWLPGDGSTSCLNSCGCRWVMTIQNNEASGESTVLAVWTLDPIKEHCEPRNGLAGCTERSGYMESLLVPPGVAIPPYIGVG